MENSRNPSGFHPRESLWKTVEDSTPEHSFERNEIKEVIGHSLVDETIELNSELSSLQEILNDLNLTSSITGAACDALPEPPFLRKNLEKQITVLVELLQQKMSRSNGELGLPAILSEDEREIIKSVSRCGPRSCSEESLSNTKEVLETPKQRPQTPLPCVDITISEIDKLANELRKCFNEEREQLLEDISKVQVSLLSGRAASKESSSKPRRSSATIKELQHLNNKLEKEVTQSKNHVPAPPVGAKWCNNFQKPTKLSPTPPSTGSRSSYTRSNLVVQSAVKRPVLEVKTAMVTMP